MFRLATILRLFVFLLVAGSAFLSASSSVTKYQTPPDKIAALVDAPLSPLTLLSPDKSRVLLVERAGMASISELAQNELRLAGMRLNPASFGPSRARTYRGLSIVKVAGGQEIEVSGVPDVPIMAPSWSPDGAHIAFILKHADGMALWVADAASGKARDLTGKILNGTMGRNLISWSGNSLITLLRIQGQGHLPAEPEVPEGPNVQETTGKEAPVRTFQDLLKNPHDEALFEYLLSSQVARVSLDGTISRLGKAGLHRRVNPSPDGNFLLLETMHRPFSYLVPHSRFPKVIEVWDNEGQLVYGLADLPLAENIPKGFGAVREGPRSVQWRADAAATLAWTETQDGGNPRTKVPVREKVFTLAAPFDGEPALLAELNLRFASLSWGDGQLALVSEYWRRSRKTMTWILTPDQPQTPKRVLHERSYEDRYADPGSPVQHHNQYGEKVLMRSKDGKALFYSGNGASPQGNIPFLDRLDLKTLQTKRLWHSQAPYYERVADVIDANARQILTLRESTSEPSNLYLRNRKKGSLVALTRFPHPTPELAGVQKELIKYERDDGVQLTATLYLPPGYKPEDGPLPMLMWAYPREFKSAAAAGQVRSSPYQFIRISYWGPLPYLTQGYAVLEGPTMPIIGAGDQEPNDTYRMQLVSSAKAAVDEMVRRGIADRERIAIGGHSYGAFMVANLLAHSDLFRAGIARSGAYNRSLTPFGFQAEERTFWEATDIYSGMSPFFHAQKIDEPLLFIHGEVDNNSGTFPLQSRRMFHAVKGLGGTARLVMLPKESHGYRARESMLHTLWEQFQWLEKHVKPTKDKEKTKNPS